MPAYGRSPFPYWFRLWKYPKASEWNIIGLIEIRECVLKQVKHSSLTTDIRIVCISFPQPLLCPGCVEYIISKAQFRSWFFFNSKILQFWSSNLWLRNWIDMDLHWSKTLDQDLHSQCDPQRWDATTISWRKCYFTINWHNFFVIFRCQEKKTSSYSGMRCNKTKIFSSFT